MLPVATHAQVISVISPVIMLLFCLALPTALAMTVIHAISMSASGSHRARDPGPLRRGGRLISRRPAVHSPPECPPAD